MASCCSCFECCFRNNNDRTPEPPSLKSVMTEQDEEEVEEATTKARVISSIDFESKTFHLTTQNLSSDVWGFSHRWEVRDGAETWQVICGDERYTCLMFPHEVHNIQDYLDGGECIGLWLDYVCINQNDEQDKCAQVGIMGSLYMTVTSLVVGKGLAPVMPAIDYTDRAWCMQERMFGRIKFPQNFEEADEEHVQKFASEMISRLPGLRQAKKYFLKDSCYWDWNEHWRVDSIREQRYNEMYEKCNELLEEIVESIQNEDYMKTCFLGLKIRERVNADLNIDQKAWTNLMNSCSATYQHDRIYGLWGVVMNGKGVSMPYDDTNKALSLLHQHCPQSCFSYPYGGLLDQVSYTEYPELDVDRGLASVHELTMQRFERECKEEYKRGGKGYPLLVDVTVGNEVYGYDQYNPKDVKFRIVADDTSIGLAYDDPPESENNRTLRIVFGLTFWQAYRDEGNKMDTGDPLGNLFEHAFYRRAWHNEGGTWKNNRAFWGLGNDDWKWKFRTMEYLLKNFICDENSPLQCHLDKCKEANDAHGVTY